MAFCKENEYRLFVKSTTYGISRILGKGKAVEEVAHTIPGVLGSRACKVPGRASDFISILKLVNHRVTEGVAKFRREIGDLKYRKFPLKDHGITLAIFWTS